MEYDGEWYKMEHHFQYDERLGVSLPRLEQEWRSFTSQEQGLIIELWQQQRAKIPERIYAMEQSIKEQQQLLQEEENFQRSCEINREIAKLASIIHDLQILFREDPELWANDEQWSEYRKAKGLSNKSQNKKLDGIT